MVSKLLVVSTDKQSQRDSILLWQLLLHFYQLYHFKLWLPTCKAE